MLTHYPDRARTVRLLAAVHHMTPIEAAIRVVTVTSDMLAPWIAILEAEHEALYGRKFEA